jgi:hypothetical protein
MVKKLIVFLPIYYIMETLTPLLMAITYIFLSSLGLINELWEESR